MGGFGASMSAAIDALKGEPGFDETAPLTSTQMGKLVSHLQQSGVPYETVAHAAEAIGSEKKLAREPDAALDQVELSSRDPTPVAAPAAPALRLPVPRPETQA